MRLGRGEVTDPRTGTRRRGEMNKIIEAARFADKCHAGQVRKYTGAPYITHPARVATRVMLLPRTSQIETEIENMVCAAWLHDVAEDCHVQAKEIVAKFGPSVESLVWFLTNRSKQHPELNREARKRMDRERLSDCSSAVKIIKLMDRIDNLNEMSGAPADFLRVYLTESRLLLDEALRGTDAGLEAELSDVIDRLAVVK